MTLKSETVTELENLRDHLKAVGKHSHRGHPSDLSYTIGIIVRRYQAGDILMPDEVAEWARENGWDEDGAAQLSNDVETVNSTLRFLQK